MFLYDQHETGLPVHVYQSTIAERHFEYLCFVHRFGRDGDDSSTLFVLTATLDIENAIEFLILEMYLNLYSIGQTADNHFRFREVGSSLLFVIALSICVSNVPVDTDTYGLMSRSIAQRVQTADLFQTRIFASIRRFITVPVIGAVVVASALDYTNQLAVTIGI